MINTVHRLVLAVILAVAGIFGTSRASDDIETSLNYSVDIDSVEIGWNEGGDSLTYTVGLEGKSNPTRDKETGEVTTAWNWSLLLRADSADPRRVGTQGGRANPRNASENMEATEDPEAASGNRSRGSRAVRSGRNSRVSSFSVSWIEVNALVHLLAPDFDPNAALGLAKPKPGSTLSWGLRSARSSLRVEFLCGDDGGWTREVRIGGKVIDAASERRLHKVFASAGLQLPLTNQ